MGAELVGTSGAEAAFPLVGSGYVAATLLKRDLGVMLELPVTGAGEAPGIGGSRDDGRREFAVELA